MSLWVTFLYRKSNTCSKKMGLFKTRKSTIGLIMLEPRTLVKCVLCLANCAGTLHCNVCDVGLTVLDFCTLVSILWIELHWTVHAGTSACYEVVIKLQLTRSRYIETLKCCHSWFIRFLSVFVCFGFFLFAVGGVLYLGVGVLGGGGGSLKKS